MNRPTTRLGRLLVAVALVAAAFALPLALSAAPASAGPALPQICRDPHLTGVCQDVTTGIPDLNGSIVGDNTATSVRVPAGWHVVLFEHPNYSGACQEFNTDDGWLPASIVGDDRASSVRVYDFPVTANICGKRTVQAATRGINHFETFSVEYSCPYSHPYQLRQVWNLSSANVTAAWYPSPKDILVTYTNWNLTGHQSVGLRYACGMTP